jgi:hypothetical protein
MGEALKHVPAVIALAALVIYGYLSICYDAFYRALGVDPGDVGLSYAAILARSSGFVLVMSYVAVFCLPLLLSSRPPSRPRRDAAWVERDVKLDVTPAQRRLAERLSRRLVLLLVAALLTSVFFAAEDAARDVRVGRAVRPMRPPVPGVSIPLTVLAIHADPASVEPAGKFGDSPAADRLRGRRLLYLGQEGGTVVLYDAAAQRAVYVPASAVILQVAN